ncbi:MFS transporter [Benzoatithermus flavus]|uniref:MFS transporter n=1 Tax=Benzoatithermus flavus TaxID=3108223 RepID=A0ABU8XQF7_9PROT
MQDTTSAHEQRLSGWVAFRHRDFALYCAARFLSALAIQMQTVAVGWLVYDLTRDPLALGLVGLAGFLPAICFALLTGHVADRFDRRGVLLLCYALTMASAAGLLLVARQNTPPVWPIYALILLFGTARAFANPAGQALVPNLVPIEHFKNAVAWNSSAWQTATIAGPALGGVLYAFGGTVVFAAATFCFALTFLLLLAMHPRGVRGIQEKASWTGLLAGIRFIRSRPAILGAISLDLFAVLLGGATALLPIYARDILHVGPWGLGILRSMPAVGAVVMAVLLAHRPLSRRTGRRMFQAVAVFGLATIGFGLSTSLPLSLLFLFVMGAADMISVFVRQTLVQIETPDAMRGRVAAVNAVFIGASNELGEFESGVLAALIGAVPAVVVGGIGTLVVAGLWARWFPALRERDRLVT